MVLARTPPPSYAINIKYHGHIPYPMVMNPIENGYGWIANMAAISDIV